MHRRTLCYNVDWLVCFTFHGLLNGGVSWRLINRWQQYKFEKFSFFFLKKADLNGQNFWPVTGHMLTGQCKNFVHMVTGHTLG